jgi:HAD superfamily hydrolase (TIGR01549 family)
LVKAVLFDWDGTLYDIFDFMVTTYTDVMKERGVRAWTPREYREKFRIDWRDMLDEMGLKEHEEYLIEKWKANMREMQDKLRLHAGALEALEKLKERYVLGIVTAGPRKALDSELIRLGLDGVMNVTIAGDDVENGKPNPDPLLHAAEKLGVKPAECVYVGDMTEDVQAARKAGMHPVAVSWGLHCREKLAAENMEFIADNFNTLIDYISQVE